MKAPRKYFEPLAIGAPRPLLELPSRLDRMIHFVPPHIEKVRAKVSESRWSEAVQEHALILAALESRDARRAGDLMRQHVARTGEVVRDSMDERLR